MKLSFAFRLASFLLALSGFLSLILTGDIPPLIVIPGLMAFGINLIQLMTGGEGPIFSKRTWYGMTLVVFVLFIVDMLWVSKSILHSTTHFLIFLMMNKLFNLSTAKAYLQLYLLSFLQLLAASGLSPGLSYALSFLIFLILAVWTLILYHLQREVEIQEKNLTAPSWNDPIDIRSPHDGIQAVINLPFFTATNMVAVSAFSLALLLFFLIPRIGTGMFSRGNAETVKVSGFSDAVRLGTIGPVKLDPTVVMRVVMVDEGSWKGPLYLRGTAYDYYDGMTWKKNQSQKHPIYQNEQGDFRISHEDKDGQEMVQEIISEPLDTPIVFGLPKIIAVRGRFSTLYSDPLETLFLPFTPTSRFSYRTTSQMTNPTDQKGGMHLSITSNEQRYYLQLPNSMQKVQTLSQEVTQNMKSPFQKATTLEGFLKSNYRYSLDIPPSASRNPIEEFLFERKTGYCEHYASAMVLMLRTLGIPARMVSGFVPTEWNNYGNYFTVRQKDAHTWVEAFFPGSGWKRFDPTPAVGTSAGDSRISPLSRYFENLRFKWDRYIIQYSIRDQVAIVKTLQKNASSVQVKSTQFLRDILLELKSLGFSPSPKGGLPIILVLVLILLLAGGAFLFFHKAKKHKIHTENQDDSFKKDIQKVLPLYLSMLDLLKDHGLIKEPFQTPNEFLRTMRIQESPFTSPASEMTQIYINVRFGRTPFSSQLESRGSELLKNMRGIGETVVKESKY